MPRRRRVLFITTNPQKCNEMRRSLSKYDVEVEQVQPPVDGPSPNFLLECLMQRGDKFYVNGVVREEMNLFQAPPGGMAEFKAHYLDLEDWQTVPEAPLDHPLHVEKHDGRAVIASSRLVVWKLPMTERRRIRELWKHQQSMALHTHPSAASTSTSTSTSTTNDDTEDDLLRNAPDSVQKIIYEHSAEGFLDFSRRSEIVSSLSSSSLSDTQQRAPFGWDDIFVHKATNLTYHEMFLRGGDWCGKVSPRDLNVSDFIIENLHYKKRKSHKFLSSSSNDDGSAKKEDRQTISFSDKDSVGCFVQQQEHMNNESATKSGLTDVFYAVANQGAFFRSARTRREVNYWLPGLNAGIPYVAKRDPIHEVTFLAHDFGHFLIPDLIYTGSTTPLVRKCYILYRMMSEATTLVFADMLFVETLRSCGKYDYDWAKRKIHPLFQATGLDPFGADQGREGFFQSFRLLLEANVAFCLLGDESKFVQLIERAGLVKMFVGSDGKKTCEALEKFKDKYMPFFVEDYKWTTANFENMRAHSKDYEEWWRLVAPMARASGVVGGASGGTSSQLNIGLETVQEHLEAIGVSSSSSSSLSSPPTEILINLIFHRVFETRIRPIFGRSEENRIRLASPSFRRTQSFVRWMLGQAVIFSRFSFVPEANIYAELILGRATAVLSRGENLSSNHVENARSAYSQFVRILGEKALITQDDVVNYMQVCPLFTPVYVFYDESKSFYEELSSVQRKILAADDRLEEEKVGSSVKTARRLIMWFATAAAAAHLIGECW